MHYFQYRGASLFAEGVRVERIAEEAGTPVFIYSQRTLKRHYEAFGSAFKKAAHIICYSVKANSNLSVLKTFADLGSGFGLLADGHYFLRTDTARPAFRYTGASYGSAGSAAPIATELDLILSYKANDNLGLAFGGGAVLPGTYLKDNLGPDSGVFLYAQMVATF